MNRQEFISTACKGVCGVVVLGALATFAEGCSTLKTYKTSAPDGQFTVPLATFAENAACLVTVEGLTHSVLVSKRADGTFSAVLMKCTHHDYALVANSRGLSCSLHGSMFDLEGNVKNGPAVKPLRRFETTVVDGSVVVK